MCAKGVTKVYATFWLLGQRHPSTPNPKPHEDRVYYQTQNTAERTFEDFFECDLAC